MYVRNPSKEPSIDLFYSLSLYPLTQANALAKASVGSIVATISSATG
jgi:hypothetical protein